MIYRYKVMIIDSNPMYGTDKEIKDFGADKDGAIKWAKENYKRFGNDSDSICVAEYEYTSEQNLKKNFNLCKRYIWSVWIDAE